MWCSQAEYLGTASVTEVAANRLAETVLPAVDRPRTVPGTYWRVALDTSGFTAKRVDDVPSKQHEGTEEGKDESSIHVPLASLLVCHLVFEEPRIVVWVISPPHSESTASGLQASVWRLARKDQAVRLFQVFHELSGKLRLERLGLSPRQKKIESSPTPPQRTIKVNTGTIEESKENVSSDGSWNAPKPPPRLKKKKKSSSLLPESNHKTENNASASSQSIKSSQVSDEELQLEGMSEDKKALIMKLLTPATKGRPMPEKPPAETRQREPNHCPPPPPEFELPPTPPASPPPPPSGKKKGREAGRTVITGGRRIVLTPRAVLSTVSYNSWIDQSGSGDPQVHSGALRRVFGTNPVIRTVVRKPSIKSKPLGGPHLGNYQQSRLARSYHSQPVEVLVRSGSLTSQGSSEDSITGNEPSSFPKSVLKKAKRPNTRRSPQKKNVTFNAYTRVQVMEE